MTTMDLWNQVCETDPVITKKVNQRGGFTAICAQAQLKTATELWGPYGGSWGVKDLHYTHHQSGENIPAVSLIATFYCPGDIEFPIGTDMAYMPGNDTYKKLLTDLTTKALSKLGFNSDVFEGKFDDNKYVATMTQKFSDDGPIDALVAEALGVRIAAVGGDETLFLAHFGVKKLADIRQSQWAKADRLLKAREKECAGS